MKKKARIRKPSYKEEKVYLDNEQQLTQEFPCPLCGNMLKYEKYRCENCKIELAFYIKNI